MGYVQASLSWKYNTDKRDVPNIHNSKYIRYEANLEVHSWAILLYSALFPL